jgi:hypothetical protein
MNGIEQQAMPIHALSFKPLILKKANFYFHQVESTYIHLYVCDWFFMVLFLL